MMEQEIRITTQNGAGDMGQAGELTACKPLMDPVGLW